MISSTEQLDTCLSLVEKLLKELQEEGYSVKRPFIGIMVEVPSCLSLLPFWLHKIDFISIGTNDLSQYLLAVDRNNPHVSKWFDPLHPSILHELLRITQIVKGSSVPVSICGEMAADPIAVVLLLGMGIRRFSMSATKIPLVKSLINEISIHDTQQIFATAIALDRASKIHTLGLEFLKSAWSHAPYFLGHKEAAKQVTANTYPSNTYP
ncbi:hypothetical protein P4S72_05580 [Vibrio sp. PP-XX7]